MKICLWSSTYEFRPVYDNEKENWRILTNKEIYASVKKPTIMETRLNRLRWLGHVHRMEENRILKRVLYMNLGTRLTGRPRNRWQDEVRGLVEKGGRKKYIREKNVRSSWEQQGINAFYTRQQNEWMDTFHKPSPVGAFLTCKLRVKNHFHVAANVTHILPLTYPLPQTPKITKLCTVWISIIIHNFINLD